MASNTIQYKDTGAYYNTKRLLTEDDNTGTPASGTTGQIQFNSGTNTFSADSSLYYVPASQFLFTKQLAIGDITTVGGSYIQMEDHSSFNRWSISEWRLYDRTGAGDFVTFKGGNVGIGTSTPGAKLDVKGHLQTSGGAWLGLQDNGGGQLNLGNNPGDNKIFLEAFSSDRSTHATELLLTGAYGSNGPLMTINMNQTNINGHFKNIGNFELGGYDIGSEGKIGVSTYGAGTGLLRFGGWNVGNVWNDGFVYNPRTGNVGIGTTTPIGKLDVQGGHFQVRSGNDAR